MQSASHVCSVCAAPSKLRCSKCKVRRYCSPKCQKSDWKTHKTTCGATDGAKAAKEVKAAKSGMMRSVSELSELTKELETINEEIRNNDGSPPPPELAEKQMDLVNRLMALEERMRAETSQTAKMFAQSGKKSVREKMADIQKSVDAEGVEVVITHSKADIVRRTLERFPDLKFTPAELCGIVKLSMCSIDAPKFKSMKLGVMLLDDDDDDGTPGGYRVVLVGKRERTDKLLTDKDLFICDVGYMVEHDGQTLQTIPSNIIFTVEQANTALAMKHRMPLSKEDAKVMKVMNGEPPFPGLQEAYGGPDKAALVVKFMMQCQKFQEEIKAEAIETLL